MTKWGNTPTAGRGDEQQAITFAHSVQALDASYRSRDFIYPESILDAPCGFGRNLLAL